MKRCALSPGILFCVIAISIMFNLTMLQPTAEADFNPILEHSKKQLINFDKSEETQYADSRPGENNSVIFTGMIDGSYFSGSNITKIVCSLKAEIKQIWYSDDNEVHQNWFSEVSPEIIELGKDEIKEFKVIVIVPPETSFYSKGELKVTGTAVTYPDNRMYSVNEINGKIRILYYEDWQISSTEVSKTIKRGETATYRITIHNLGNGQDIFFQDVGNSNELRKSDIRVEFPINTELDEKSSKDIILKVKTNENTPPGSYPIEFLSYPTDVEDIEGTENEFYKITVLLIIEPDFIEEYLWPSLIITVIIIVIVAVKLVLISNKRTEKNKKRI